MADKLPILDLKRSYAAIRDEINEALERVFESQSFILGPEVRAFEEDVESYLESGTVADRTAVGCASGTDALLLALMALDVGPGDEVVTTPYSFFATASCITRLGAVPVFADIDPATCNIDLKEAAAKFTAKTKVFLPVHLFGQTVPVEEIAAFCRERGVAVVEDAAQAFGAWRRIEDENAKAANAVLRAGVMGDIGCYSFFPTKNLGACGDAGMAVAADPRVGERLRKLRVHGAGTTYLHEEVGLNSRLDAIQAAILRVKLRRLEAWNAERRVLADRYRLLFGARGLVGEHVTLPAELAGNCHIYHQYVIRAKRRDALMEFLEQRGISARVYYPLPLHLQKCFAFRGYKEGAFPESERLARESLALPVFNGLLAEEQERLADAAAEFYTR
ncbi:MAG: DegT/DnrJ/EryC1/StrS family aminotransferase [Synergistaceae bacterium]|jgi:dTDP-4-amino-4,6-dideoxygalactose transaminase|nr:DegT/DnrJ/EryC1/StrS family aminotransferase [Synergistaceae bacterium]